MKETAISGTETAGGSHALSEGISGSWTLWTALGVRIHH